MKHNHNRPDRQSRHLLVVMTLVCLALIFFSVAEFLPVQPLREACGFVLMPIQNGIGKAGAVLSEQFKRFESRTKLQQENKELKDKISQLEEENLILAMNRTELEDFQKLYETDQAYPDYPKIEADVIGKNSGNWYRSFTINRGSRDGIKKDMNVLADGGLCGIVINTGAHWANVRSIMDEESTVSAMTITGESSCLISGDAALYDEGLLSLSQLDTEDDVALGSRLITSNISDKFLPKLLIGYLDEISENRNHLTNTGKVSPAVNFRNLRKVLVITETKESTDTSAENGKE